MTNNTNTSRSIAVKVLDRFDPARHNAASLLKSIIEQTDRKAHATDLVFGTIRNIPLIDLLIEKIADKSTKRIHKKLLNIIRLGVYEFVFAPETAEYAIVNEAVELASIVGGKKQTGFVNAVLRNVERTIENRKVRFEDFDITKIVPQNTTDGCLFKDCVLPDPEKDLCGYYSSAFSIPKWLIEKWLKSCGSDRLRQICFASNRSPSVCVQANTLKISLGELYDKFCDEGIECEIFAEDNTIRIAGKQAVNNLAGFSDGLFMIQDPTAAKVATIIAPKPGDTVADMCAAPGGKTMGLAIAMKDTGSIIATDIDDKRLAMVGMNAKRLGVSCVKAVSFEQFESAASTGRFDCVLLDVPCSNTGVMARRAEVRLRITPETINELEKIQYKLLEKAAQLVKPGGRICYSTCSICPQENGEIIRRFLKSHTDFKLESELLTLPQIASVNDGGRTASLDHDGGYAAVLLNC